MIKTYTELSKLPTFIERYRYLRLNGVVGKETFGIDRYLNQYFYQHVDEWKAIRRQVIIRDNGCDLGMPGFDIHSRVTVHHLNPVSIEDILERSDILLNPEFLITTSHNTHMAIHYGDESILISDPIVRTPNDTCPWRR